MQKISSYLYPNRIELLADLAGFTTEYTNVYQRTIKIYNGIDNTLEFDIKNADQKRIDLTTLSKIELNVMDIAGNALPNSPYTITPMTPQTTYKGLASVVIPQDDLAELNHQFLTYSVTAVKNGADVMLYADSRFSAKGKIELVGDALPTFRDDVVYDRFSGEIDFQGNVKNHTSAIPCKFYEAVATTEMGFEVAMTNYIGTIYIEGTKDSTISVESFKNAVPLQSWTTNVAITTTRIFSNIPVGDFNYFRVVWTYIDPVLIGVNNTYPTGTVDKVTAY
jgi:hypothetical protein